MEERIAECALHHYDLVLPANKGKPKDTEWTVYAAIVAEEEGPAPSCSSRLWVVSCATGTKCAMFTAPSNKNDSTLLRETTETAVLRDCHAEALARRGLVHVLWNEISHHLTKTQANGTGTGADSCIGSDVSQNKLLEICEDPIKRQSKPPQFRLRSKLCLHLYISDSPCGDASIYPLHPSEQGPRDNNDNQVLSFTGAKVIVSEKTGVQAEACGGDHQLLFTTTTNRQRPTPKDTTVADRHNYTTTSSHSGPTKNVIQVPVARENLQLLGKLRTKSGRSNLPAHLRTSCMSCSDKLVRWSLLGLQGTVLSHWIPDPLVLSSIVVSQDPRAMAQEEALCRATCRRVVDTWNHLREQWSESETDPTYQRYRDKNCTGPTVAIVAQKFLRGKSMVDFFHQQQQSTRQEEDTKQPEESNGNKDSKKRKREASPCGISLIWDQSVGFTNGIAMVELVVGARGLCQGKKPQQISDYPKLASRLSRYSLYALAQSVHAKACHPTAPGTIDIQQTSPSGKEKNGSTPVDSSSSSTSFSSYKQWKQAWGCAAVKHLRSRMFSGGPLHGWLTSS